MTKQNRSQKYRAANVEKIRENARLRYANSPVLRETLSDRRKANVERVREYARSWYAANAERVRENSKRRRAENPDTAKNQRLKRKYNITLAEVRAMLIAQGGCCAVCLKKETTTKHGWCVDHCHVTNTVRGLLCNKCNVTIARLGDTAESVEANMLAILGYLRKAK